MEIASDKKAADIVVLDIQGITPIADYFVICSGDTARQINAVAEALQESLKKEGRLALRIEGTSDSGWLLMDYGDVVVHIFGPGVRDQYHLERLWSGARLVVRVE